MYKFDYYPLYDEFNEDGGGDDPEPPTDTTSDNSTESDEPLTEEPPIDDTLTESDKLDFPEPANDNNPVEESPEIEEETPAEYDSMKESTEGENSLTENPEGERIQDASDWDSLSDQEKINRLRGIDDSVEPEQELTEEGTDNSYNGGDGKAAVADDKPDPENNEELGQADQIDANDDYDDHRYGMREGEDMYGENKSYGNSGDPTRDSLDADATYEDSHFTETDDFYKDEQAEETERANNEGRDNLRRLNEIDEERAEEEGQEEQEAQEREEEELEEQEHKDQEAKEQAQREEQERLDSLSEEELINERTARENQQASAREYYDKLGGQIADIQQNKNLYSEEEYNSYFDEKAKAQADTSNRINELQGEINQYNDRLNRLRK